MIKWFIRKGFQIGKEGIKMKTAVIAIGGNAIIKEGQKGTLEEQFDNVMSSCDHIIDLLEEGYNVVLTHGNGPHVGNSIIKGEVAKDKVPAYQMDAYGAETQGLLGYIIKQSLSNRLKERKMEKEIVSLVTQVEVSEADGAFLNPTKPVGPFFSKEEAEQLMAQKGYIMKEDSGRGYRRVVASPRPMEIIEKKAIRDLASSGYIVIAAGGGGIPVARGEEGLYHGVEAVIDKDYASALLALEIDADLLIILTGVEKVSINFGKPNQENLDVMDVETARKHMADGQFPAGSMGPKIDAALSFVETTGGSALITSIDELKRAVKGETGTRLVKY